MFWKYIPIFLFIICPFWASHAIIGGLKTFLGSTHIDCQLWFWKFSPIFLFSILPHFGPCWPFLGPVGLILGLGSSWKTFWNLLTYSTTFDLKVLLYFACRILFRMVEWGSRLEAEIKTNSALLKLEFWLSSAITYNKEPKN